MKHLFKKYRSVIAQTIGVLGTLTCLVVFILRPSWPTPDKLLIFLACVFMSFKKAAALLLRLGPFVGTLLIYESFRGLAPLINHRVEYKLMAQADTWMGFGHLITAQLQRILWHGQPRWFDFALYFVYMLHFVLPFTVALLIWRYREKLYWRYVVSFIVVSFMGFFTFVAMPAAPPWMAARDGYIQPIVRVSSEVWAHLGIRDFPSIYNKISPNPVAAVPSLHAAYATLLAIYVWRAFGRRSGLVACVYPLCIYFMTVYQGEHYLFDELIGSAYAAIAYLTEVRYYARVVALLKARLPRKVLAHL